MGFVVQARCLDCGYESSTLTIGDGKHVACICRSCNRVVNPERVEFRYALKPCPDCGAPLSFDDTLDVLNTPVDYRGTIPTQIKCPRCHKGSLAFRTVMHFSIQVVDAAPDTNTMVHGQMRDGGLQVPGMFLPRAKVIVEGLPDEPGDRTMELLTTDVTRTEEAITSITFSFVRFVDLSH